MPNLRVMVVDDSSFARSIIRDALEESGISVIAEAECMEDAIVQYRLHQPNVITMDMVMPGTNGLECIRALKLENPQLKFIINSSMKDDDLLAEAKKLNVMAYIQKPFQTEEIVAAVRKALQPNEAFIEMEPSYLEAFKSAFERGIALVTKTKVVIKENEIESAWTYKSAGLSIIVGIIGKLKGQMILDLSLDTAKKLAGASLKREPKDQNEIVAMIAEFANIVAGNACSSLNKNTSGLGLMVTPPGIFSGENSEISAPHTENQGFTAKTDYGPVFMNVGFSRGTNQWI